MKLEPKKIAACLMSPFCCEKETNCKEKNTVGRNDDGRKDEKLKDNYLGILFTIVLCLSPLLSFKEMI